MIDSDLHGGSVSMTDTIKKKIPVMPSPPDFLLQKSIETAQANLSQNQPAPRPENAPKAVDFMLYYNVVEERKIAEVRTAEIYSKYLEVVAFSERLLKKISKFETYKQKVREVYNRALMVDQITKDNLALSRQDLHNNQKIMNAMNMEMQSHLASVQAHQEAFEQMSRKLGQAEAAMHYANEQFQLLSQECENRGDKASLLEKNLNGATSQIRELTEKYKELQTRAEYLHDEHLLISNELREAQLKESAVSALNQELTESIPKLQKQIHILEEKIRMERSESENKIRILQEENDRQKDNKVVDALIEKSRKVVAEPIAPPLSLGKKREEKLANKEKWNDFYSRWNQIIGELSSHSAPLREKIEDDNQNLPPLPQLVSEKGDIDWV